MPAARLFIFSLLIIGILIQSRLNAQPKGSSPILYAITEQHGLSDNVITCFFQDQRGFMWIGTQDGLNVYDGSAIKIFRKESNMPDNLADNAISDITGDEKGRIWIATGNGLSAYYPGTGTIRSWKIQGTENSSDFNHIKCLLAEKNGKIWLGTAAGLVLFDPVTEKFKALSIRDQQTGDFRRANNFINEMLLDHQGRFWIATFTGLWRFYQDSGQFQHVISRHELAAEDELISDMLEDHEGNLWLSIWNGGIQLYDPVENRLKVFPAFRHLRENPTSIAEIRDHLENYHLFFSPSLNEFNRQSLTVSTFATNQHQNSDNLKMEKLYVSRDNLLWIATDNGVRIMDPAKQVFRHYFLSDSAFTNQGLVVAEKIEKFYAGGSAKDFLNLYDSNFNLKKRLLPNFKGAQSDNKEFPALLNITREDSNHIWLCTEKGICFLDEKTGKTRIYSIDAKTSTSPTANFINRMLIDSKGIHWVFPWRNGIWQLQTATGQFIDVFDGFIREFNIQKKLLIADAVEDHLGNIWMADLDEGLIHYDREKQSFGKPLADILGPKFQLQNVLFEKPFIWLVTNGRVIRINAENKSREIWPMPVAFNKPITGYCSDQFNHIWITTINGLICFDKANKQFKRFSTNDGLVNNNMHGMIISLHDGNLLYAEENYVTRFDPRLLLKNELNTLPEITGVYSQNQSMQFRDEPGKQKKIDLQYKNNDLTFRWALPSFSNPLQNQYYCKLDGVDKDWKYVGNKGEAQYASLNPGTYIFEAAAAAGNGLMSKKPDTIMVVISPPLWKQWWFIAAIAGLVIVLLYYLYWLRLNQLLRMERLRSQISSDLHDDIGSTLSSISIISDLAIQEEKSGQLDLIKEIRENSTNLMEKMDDIVWSINPNNDTLENLMLRIKLFAAKLFEARNIEYTIDIKDNISQVKLPMNFRQHIYLILKESINNLVKYSEASHASLEVSFNKPILHVKIHDNGKGFSDKEPSVGNGILNMKARAAMMKAALNIQSQPGEGTTIDFKVKIK